MKRFLFIMSKIILKVIMFTLTLGIYYLYTYLKKKNINKSDTIDILTIVFVFLVSLVSKIIVFCIIESPSSTSIVDSFAYILRAIYASIGGFTFEGLYIDVKDFGQMDWLALLYHYSSLFAGGFFLGIASGRLNYELRCKADLLSSELGKNIFVFTTLSTNSLLLAKNIFNNTDIDESDENKDYIIFAGHHLQGYDKRDDLCRQVESNGFKYCSTKKDIRNDSISKSLSLDNNNYLQKTKDLKFCIFAFNEDLYHAPSEEENLDIVFNDINSHIDSICNQWNKVYKRYGNSKLLYKIFIKKLHDQKWIKKFDRLRIDYYILTKRDVNYEVYTNSLIEAGKKFSRINKMIDEYKEFISKDDFNPNNFYLDTKKFYQLHIVNNSNLMAKCLIESINNDLYFKKSDITKSNSSTPLLNQIDMSNGKTYKVWSLGFGEVGQTLMEAMYIHTSYVSNEGEISKFSARCFDEKMEERRGLYKRERPYFMISKSTPQKIELDNIHKFNDLCINNNKIIHEINEIEITLADYMNNNISITYNDIISKYPLLSKFICLNINKNPFILLFDNEKNNEKYNDCLFILGAIKRILNSTYNNYQELFSPELSSKTKQRKSNNKYAEALRKYLITQYLDYKTINNTISFLKQVILNPESKSKEDITSLYYKIETRSIQNIEILRKIGIPENSKLADSVFFNSPFTKIFETGITQDVKNRALKECEDIIIKLQTLTLEYENSCTGELDKITVTTPIDELLSGEINNPDFNSSIGLPTLYFENLSCMSNEFIKMLDSVTGNDSVNDRPDMFIIALGNDFNNIKLANIILDDIREEFNLYGDSGKQQIIVINVYEKENEKLIRWTEQDNLMYGKIRIITVGNTDMLYTKKKLIDFNEAKDFNYAYNLLYNPSNDCLKDFDKFNDIIDYLCGKKVENQHLSLTFYKYLAEVRKNLLDSESKNAQYKSLDNLDKYNEKYEKFYDQGLIDFYNALKKETIGYREQYERITYGINDCWYTLRMFEKESNVKAVEFLPIYKKMKSDLEHKINIEKIIDGFDKKIREIDSDIDSLKELFIQLKNIRLIGKCNIIKNNMQEVTKEIRNTIINDNNKLYDYDKLKDVTLSELFSIASTIEEKEYIVNKFYTFIRVNIQDPQIQKAICEYYMQITTTEHLRWLRFYLVNGWRLGYKAGVTIFHKRDDIGKYHNCLVPLKYVPKTKILFDLIPAILIGNIEFKIHKKK